MTKRRLTGSFVALITPMNEDYSIDHAGFRALIEVQAAHGTSSLLLMGSTGEVSMLSREERHAIVEETVGLAPDGMELWYGCTGATTDATIDYVEQAGKAGADGAIIAAPSYICAPGEDIVRFFLDVADASPIPIGVYNNPPRIKTDLNAEQLTRIAAHENVLVLKESTERVGQAAQMAASGADISLMCCDNPYLGLVVPTMALGGHGTANMSGNIIPAEMASLSKPWTETGDADRFRATYLRILPMLEYTYSAVNPIALKSFLSAVGMPAGPMRRPLRPLDEAGLEAGLRVARTLRLDERYGYDLS